MNRGDAPLPPAGAGRGFRSIRLRLTGAFSLLFVVVLALIQLAGTVGIPFTPYPGWRGQQRVEAFNSLNLVADLKKDRLLRWMEERSADAHVIAHSDMTVEKVVQLQGKILDWKADGREGEELWALVRQDVFFRGLVDYLDLTVVAHETYDRVSIADAESGLIFVSTDVVDLGRDVLNATYFAGALRSRDSYVSDVLHSDSGQNPTLIISHIIRAPEGDVVALLIIEVNADHIIRPMLHTGEGLGKSGEALLVNQDVRILTSLKHPIPDGGIARPLEYRIQSKPAALAASGEEGIIETDDYRDEPVLAAYRHIRVNTEWSWGMVVKRDLAELYAPTQRSLTYTVVISLAGTVAVVGLTAIVARDLTHPIRALSETAIKVTAGDLAARAPVTTTDEVGLLAMSFNRMVQRIQHWRDELEEQVTVRTAELSVANEALVEEVAGRMQAEVALQAYSDRLEQMVKERTQELQDAQEKLLHQERLAVLGELAGGVGHELRNPLGVITNAIYFLKMVMPDADERVREYLSLIDTEAQNGTRIVADLLDYAHIGSSDPQSTQVSALISATLEKSSVPTGISVEIRVPNDLSPIWVDPFQITQVLNNLISNACQAMPEGGTLTVAATVAPDGIEVSIADTGTGIAPENMGKIFEPLFTTKARGIGLGLAISKNLIAANGGSIDMKSVVGEGSTFSLLLPVRSAPGDELSDDLL